MFEVLHAVRLEEHQEDQGPQAQDEAVRRMPVSLFGFLKGGETGDGWGEGRGRDCWLVIMCIYPPVEATADCSVIHTGRLHHFISAHTFCTLTHRFRGSHRKRVVELISTPPVSCVCPIHCHIITLCTIIL